MRLVVRGVEGLRATRRTEKGRVKREDDIEFFPSRLTWFGGMSPALKQSVCTLYSTDDVLRWHAGLEHVKEARQIIWAVGREGRLADGPR